LLCIILPRRWSRPSTVYLFQIQSLSYRRLQLHESPTRDNLVSACSCSFVMAPVTGTGSGKDMVTSMDVVVQRLDRLDKMLHDQIGKVGSLAGKVGDIDNQQQALSVTLICLERNKCSEAAPVTRRLTRLVPPSRARPWVLLLPGTQFPPVPPSRSLMASATPCHG
jgi:hypothetical protein